MTRRNAFREMLRQQALHFTASQIVHVLFAWEQGDFIGFMLYMQNGEYWYTTNFPTVERFSLTVYPSPIPPLRDLVPATPFSLHPEMFPAGLNADLKAMGNAPSLFMTLHDQ